MSVNKLGQGLAQSDQSRNVTLRHPQAENGAQKLEKVPLPRTSKSSRRQRIGPVEILLLLTVLAAFAMGGAPNAANWKMLALCALSAALIPIALRAGPASNFVQMPMMARITLISIVLLPLLQLVPLPPSLWTLLPGRETSTGVYALMGAADSWRPFTETPAETTIAALALIPSIAIFLATITLDSDQRSRIVTGIGAFALVSIFVGLVQFGTNGSLLDIYDTAHRGSFLGFFANRNHQALFLALTATWTLFELKRRLKDNRLALAVSLLASIVFLIASVGTLSRAGIALTLAGITAAFYYCFLRKKVSWKLLSGGAVAAIALLYWLASSPTVQRAIDRFSSAGENERWTIWERSEPLVTKFFPFGAGIGSYEESYKSIELLAHVSPVYYNRAHNDYLELVIETGAIGILLALLFAACIVTQTVKILRDPPDRAGFEVAAAISIGLIALHSLLDYPLRTEAIAALFSFALAVLFSHQEEAGQNGSAEIATLRQQWPSLVGQTVVVLGVCVILFVRASSSPPPALPGAALINGDAPQLTQSEEASLRRAVLANPLDQSLLNRIYANEVRQDPLAANRQGFIRLLESMGWRDLATQQNLLFEAAGRNDLESTLDHFEAIVRRDRLRGEIYPLLVQLERDPAGAKALAERLARQPDWRNSYFRYAEHLSDPQMRQARVDFLNLLYDRGFAVTRAELVETLNALASGGQRQMVAEIAGRSTSGLLEDELIYDPDFSRWAALQDYEREWWLPYEWRRVNEVGVSSQIIVSDGDGEFRVRWDGRGAPEIARTMTFAQAGSKPKLELELGPIGSVGDVEKFSFELRCRNRERVSFRDSDIPQSMATADRLVLSLEEPSPCDYPDLVISARPQTIDRGADLFLKAIRLSSI